MTNRKLTVGTLQSHGLFALASDHEPFRFVDMLAEWWPYYHIYVVKTVGIMNHDMEGLIYQAMCLCWFIRLDIEQGPNLQKILAW